MNKNLKIGLTLLIVASVLFLCSTVAFFILKEAEKDKRLYLERELRSAEKAKESITKRFEETKIVNRDLEIKLNSAREEAKRISEELTKEKEAKRQFALQLEEESRKTSELMADIMKEKEERLNLVHQLSRSEEANRQLKEKFELMVDAKETLEDKLKKMMAKKGVELEKIEVKSGYEDKTDKEIELTEETIASETKKSADVLVINRKFDFIVTNIGKSDGVGVGTELDIYRGDRFIAKTKIEKLYDAMSAATILPKWLNANIREGDQVYISR